MLGFESVGDSVLFSGNRGLPHRSHFKQEIQVCHVLVIVGHGRSPGSSFLTVKTAFRGSGSVPAGEGVDGEGGRLADASAHNKLCRLGQKALYLQRILLPDAFLPLSHDG